MPAAKSPRSAPRAKAPAAKTAVSKKGRGSASRGSASSATEITVRGAREHNLRDVSLVLPKDRLVVFTGVSGSGKSSLAFDTLYAEGQRRYVESLSSYARQFLGQMPKPEVDYIGGLAPSISIQQKTAGRNPRSTVGTITEVYDYLRVLYARVGQGYCYKSGLPIRAQSTDQIVASIGGLGKGARFAVLAPLIRDQKGEYKDLFEDLARRGHLRARVDGETCDLSSPPALKRHFKHTIEVVVDRLVAGSTGRTRLAEAVEQALKLSGGTLLVVPEGGEEKLYSADYSCPESGMSYEPPSPQLFSFNSPAGMCKACQGLGVRHEFDEELLVADEKKPVRGGALNLLKPFKDLGKWKKHIYEGAAAAIEEDHGLAAKSFLKTPWAKLPEAARRAWLDGLGSRHVTFHWRGRGGWKHGGEWPGFLHELLEAHREVKNPMRRRQLEKFMLSRRCGACGGTRLNQQANHVRLRTSSAAFAEEHGKDELSLPEVCALPISAAAEFFTGLVLTDTDRAIATEAVKEVAGRLGFLLKCGLHYLSLDRSAPTLSGGEAQRIRLAGQIGCGLVGVLYILDEPSIGLHPRDNTLLLDSLRDLRDRGNTVLVVEHDEETMRAADHVVDFGPGPGVRGGELVASGSVEDVMRAPRSLTGQYLSGKKAIEVPAERRMASRFAGAARRRASSPNGNWITITGATHNNLKDVTAEIPCGALVCVTGVSGSGKSSLTNDVLWQALNRDVNEGHGEPGAHAEITGLEHFDKAIDIDQSPIGRTPRSNPATYVKVFDQIRQLYTKLPQSALRGFEPGRFSFNVPGGRCEHCEGHGATKLEMDFLADIWVPCPVCEERRFSRETLEVKFKGASVADVLNMDVAEALVHFENVPKIRRLLQTLVDVGLDYLKLGQPSPTLSGGEAQRIKLARELGKRSTGSTFYLLDEPTTGLHFADVHNLLDVLQGFVTAGNTVLVVEHSLDVIKTADWVIDMGPDGGAGGGRVVAAGTPEDVAACDDSFTGRALRDVLPAYGRHRKPASAPRPAAPTKTPPIVVRGASQHNLQNVDLTLPRGKMSVFAGPSGSGKSSLAMDTLYAEGQRRYVESLSSYARQFLGQMPKPRVDSVTGLSPAVAIEQKTVGSTPRSTVGTVTEVYDYLRILFARLGTPHCPACGTPVGTSTTDEVVGRVLGLGEIHRNGSPARALLLAPQEIYKGETYEELFERLKGRGYGRVRVDGETHPLDSPPKLDRRGEHVLEVVVDRVTLDPAQRGRLTDSIEQALDLGRGVLRVAIAEKNKPEPEWLVKRFSLHAACETCDRSFEPLSPQNFSFNSPLGWCDACEGLGNERGTDQSVLIADPTRSINDGAVTAWPDPANNPQFAAILTGLAGAYGLDLDAPFDALPAAARRAVLYGGEKWVTATPAGSPPFRFQYRGLYPSLTEASRVSYKYRQSLRDLVGDKPCSRCDADRVRDDAAAVTFRGKTLPALCRLPLTDALAFLKSVELTGGDRKVAGDLLKEATHRLGFLVEVGLTYLTLDRAMPTLSGGESQRIRLAGQVGRSLTGVLYVLDEPTIGLHPRDNGRLLKALKKLRDLGNTVVLVEHDKEVIEAADRLVDFGPGSGRLGGTVTAEGTPRQVARRKSSVTGRYLSGRDEIKVPTARRAADGPAVQLLGVKHHNLRDVDLTLPLGTLTCITGVSGSGKSSLIEGALAPALARALGQSGRTPGPFRELKGAEHLSKIVAVDQAPLGATPASNPATYTGAFDLIRELFCRLPAAKARGYKPARFSFNRPGGRCEACEGLGQRKIEMHFLPDVWVDCDACGGKRYTAETLAVTYKDRSIADVLEMSIGGAYDLFANVPKIRAVLGVLRAIGLDYLSLGQSAPTLSGGEAQRVKLASELARPDAGRTLYLLDEPTTGLHLADIAKLLEVLNGLVERGNTVVVIEHNLDVIKTADWLIDLGPEAGSGGGRIVADGTPESVVADAADISHTARLLKPVLEQSGRADRAAFDVEEEAKQRDGDTTLTKFGRDEKAPWQTDGVRWHTADRLAHNGKPARWEGELLSHVVSILEEAGDFAPANWGERSVVELTAPDAEPSGWFLHAKTAQEWFCSLTFRVKDGAFDEAALRKRFPWRPADELDLPVYGPDPRVRVRNLASAAGGDGGQEVTFRPHWLHEVDTPQFRAFLGEARASYFETADAADPAADDAAPWERLGRRWHVSPKGFTGRGPKWTPAVLDALAESIEAAVPGAAAKWTAKTIVPFTKNGDAAAFAELHTKRPAGLDLTIPVPPGSVALGRVATLGAERELARHRGGEAVKVRFRTVKQASDPNLRELLKELAG